jgi:hypothetical protein
MDGAAGGIRAFLRDFKTYDLDRGTVGCLRAVFFVVGGLSNPDDYGEAAERLSHGIPALHGSWGNGFPDECHAAVRTALLMRITDL